jgi:hypothetical protein
MPNSQTGSRVCSKTSSKNHPVPCAAGKGPALNWRSQCANSAITGDTAFRCPTPPILKNPSSIIHLLRRFPILPWAELAGLLQETRSVSALFLNLLGESSRAAVPEGRALLQGTKTVLFLCGERAAASAAAKAALGWWRDVLTGERLDPVVALHRHRHGLAVAWTKYSSWRTVAPQRLEHPDLVDLLLDRRRQRAELLQAKEDFYIFRARRIYHTVALGSRGCRVGDFPNTAGQHLKLYGRKDREVVIQHRLHVTICCMSSISTVSLTLLSKTSRLRLDPAARPS